MIGEKGKPVAKGLEALAEVFLKMINLLMYYAPIGLGAYFAALVGEYGGQLIGSYTRAMVIYYPLCFIYFVVMFPIYGYIAGGKDGVRAMKHLISPGITSLATQSSIATLPVNLEAAEKIGVPKDIREIVLPIGATAHMDGTVFSSILKISFLFGIFQVPFTGVGTYVSAILLSIVGGVVMSGVPGGGLIGEMLIVTMYGFPPEAFPIIATIGYLVDPPATMINATGDTVAAMLVTRLVEGKDWMKRKLG
jgi:Na+/H+-dicarboxylate symporter